MHGHEAKIREGISTAPGTQLKPPVIRHGNERDAGGVGARCLQLVDL